MIYTLTLKDKVKIINDHSISRLQCIVCGQRLEVGDKVVVRPTDGRLKHWQCQVDKTAKK